VYVFDVAVTLHLEHSEAMRERTIPVFNRLCFDVPPCPSELPERQHTIFVK
jgi:hypothetical protein